MKLAFWIGGVLALLALKETSGQDDHPEERLRNDLFGNYKKNRRPARNVNDSVVVDVVFTLASLVHMDFLERSITASMWLQMTWNDYRLRWNSSEYDGLELLHVPLADLWQPDITLYNSIDTIQEVDDFYGLVDAGGGIFIVPTLKVKASCDLDIADYPYDTQKCHFKWGSWAHDASHISLTASLDYISLEAYAPNPWWKLESTSVMKNSVKYDCCPESYEDVTAEFTVRRQENRGRIASAVISTWLILVVFFVGPSSAGERIVFTGFIFVALVILSASLSATVPDASTTRLGRFLLAGMVITAIIAAIDGLLFRIHPKGKDEEVKWYTNVVSPRFFLIFDAVALTVTVVLLTIVSAALFA